MNVALVIRPVTQAIWYVCMKWIGLGFPDMTENQEKRQVWGERRAFTASKHGI